MKSQAKLSTDIEKIARGYKMVCKPPGIFSPTTSSVFFEYPATGRHYDRKRSRLDIYASTPKVHVCEPAHYYYSHFRFYSDSPEINSEIALGQGMSSSQGDASASFIDTLIGYKIGRPFVNMRNPYLDAFSIQLIGMGELYTSAPTRRWYYSGHPNHYNDSANKGVPTTPRAEITDRKKPGSKSLFGELRSFTNLQMRSKLNIHGLTIINFLDYPRQWSRMPLFKVTRGMANNLRWYYRSYDPEFAFERKREEITYNISHLMFNFRNVHATRTETGRHLPPVHLTGEWDVEFRCFSSILSTRQGNIIDDPKKSEGLTLTDFVNRSF